MTHSLPSDGDEGTEQAYRRIYEKERIVLSAGAFRPR